MKRWGIVVLVWNFHYLIASDGLALRDVTYGVATFIMTFVGLILLCGDKGAE